MFGYEIRHHNQATRITQRGISREAARDYHTWISIQTVLSKKKDIEPLGLDQEKPLPLESNLVKDCTSGFRFQMMSKFGTIAQGSITSNILEIPVRCTTTEDHTEQE